MKIGITAVAACAAHRRFCRAERYYSYFDLSDAELSGDTFGYRVTPLAKVARRPESNMMPVIGPSTISGHLEFGRAPRPAAPVRIKLMQ
ncbi:hypothetical protein AAFX91_18165 [Bradyrhizobium sp. 31Argb]|uniref:hypothetical protein n=1 Tax=unclassified Bradyrhizobium TaxID=2631580 RepID=UPI00102E4245|nr:MULTISPECIES: hypothetical protein [unclassified Bradyrhizobium]MDI4236733.1 hypothetical protein [Bradyrhizobium sp. Arg237L]